MKILIDMSTEHYNGLLNKCIDTLPAEYVTLKNGVVIRRQIEGVERRRIAILCEKHQAHNLLILARSLQATVVEVIRKALDTSQVL
jgi:hypothetical protein